MQPLIFMFHAGDHTPHVRESLRLIRPHVSNSRFVFAGSTAPEGCEFFDMSRAIEDHTFLEGVFPHETRNPKWWEIYAIWRWFVLARLIQETDHQGPVVCLDSDVLVFDPPGNILNRFDGALGFGCDANPPTVFFRNPSTVFDFCDFLKSAITDRTLWETIKNNLGRILDSFGGGLQEMGLIRYFCAQARERGMTVSRVNEPTADGVYDYSVAFDQPGAVRFLCDDFGKVVMWRNGVPHFLPKEGEPMRAFTLHIQGSAKSCWYRWLPKQSCVPG